MKGEEMRMGGRGRVRKGRSLHDLKKNLQYCRHCHSN